MRIRVVKLSDDSACIFIGKIAFPLRIEEVSADAVAEHVTEKPNSQAKEEAGHAIDESLAIVLEKARKARLHD